MAKPKDETGNRYGRLIVTKEAGRDNHGNVLWKCKCRCGNIKTTNCIFATRQEQSLNKRTYKNSKTGIAGINWKENIKKYVVRIGFNKIRIHLGYFTNVNDAITARKAGELKYWNKA